MADTIYLTVAKKHFKRETQYRSLGCDTGEGGGTGEGYLQ